MAANKSKFYNLSPILTGKLNQLRLIWNQAQQAYFMYLGEEGARYPHTADQINSTDPGVFPIFTAGGGSGGGGISVPGLPPPTNAAYVQVVSTSGLSAGDNDVYTVPPNRRAAVIVTGFFNTTGVNRTVIVKVKISGVYYGISQATAILTGAFGTPANMIGIIMEAGETLSFNIDVGAAVNGYAKVMEFDNTFGLKSARVLNPSAGNNTVYTVPPGKHAVALNGASPTTTAANDAVIAVSNFSGSNRSYQTFYKPSGGSNAQFGTVASLGHQLVSVILRCGSILLNPGDSVTVTTDASTTEQSAWFNHYEF